MDGKMDNKLVVSALLLFILLLVGVKQYDIQNKVKKEDKVVKKENIEIKLKMKLIINDKEYKVTLLNNQTTKELLERLPIEIEMQELNGNEKYYNFEDKFTSNPIDVKKIHKGDIMLFNDDCLVLFYDSFETTDKYTKIGSIDNIDDLELNDENIKVKIEK